ncbi:AraC-like DNA-binding protein [Kibdelosporangium banguiense]|uniref:AraC-like DNA-binding protein n=1 Tax=Kibdelosporangium banguiense TaxID=1365924 RepID=A0ABS4U1S0_9PSEU|nr:helix-turn-helix domain-containing protein [Kibdelosporangium banguiense]MBP2330599.1 AraC-like DNA-binding protein [Kibdelosporangium banguiense]
MKIAWGNDDLPARDRFAAWQEYANSTHVPTSVRSDHEGDFRATVLVTPLGPVQVSRLTYGGVVADLLAAVLHEHTGNDWISTCDQQTLAYGIRSYIDQHLADPDLSPATLAAAHHLSVRSLQRLFHAHGISVTDWIRTRRLEHCRSDLDNPLLDHRLAYVIAAKWGFVSRTHFSRLFRATYGCTPHDYRHRRRSLIPLDSLCP